MDVRYISEPEKVSTERRAMEEAAEAERKAIAKREAAKEKARKKAEEKKRIEEEKNRLIWPFLVQFVDDIKSGARKIPILNENLIIICEKYSYNIPKANEQVLNRYIKDIQKDLSEQLPSLKEKVPTKLTMKQKEALRKEKKEPETDLNGNVIVPRYDCVTSHTARRTGITNMYLSHKNTILQ